MQHIFTLLLLGASWGPSIGYLFQPVYVLRNSTGVVQDGVDPGQPLFLTPLIEAGQLDQARQQSQVGRLPNDPSGMARGAVKGHAGYLTVNKKYNSNLFFWYFPAAIPDPQGAPILLWLQGGPGGTSLFGLFVEHGPFVVTEDLNIKPREYAWTCQYHMLYIDQPVGTGFSFTDAEEGFATNQTRVADDLYQALVQFFTLFPDLQRSDFYVTGESYAGKYVPAISYKLHQEQNPLIPFRGLAIGDGLVDPVTMIDYGDYLYQVGLLDEKQRQVFLDQQARARDLIAQKEWRQATQVFKTLILDSKGQSSFLNYTGFTNHYNILFAVAPADQDYFNDYVVKGSVRRAIHVGNLTYNDGSVVDQHLTEDIMKSTAPLLAELMDHYKVLVYSGQLDVIVAYPLTANFLQALKWSGADAFKNAERVIWKVDAARDVEVAGYVRQVGDFYQVLVRNAGHMVPYDQPRAAFDMISRFIAGKPF